MRILAQILRLCNGEISLSLPRLESPGRRKISRYPRARIYFELSLSLAGELRKFYVMYFGAASAAGFEELSGLIRD